MKPSKTAILAEIVNRNTTQANTNTVQLSGDFPAQNAFINDPSRFISAQCSRRAGKTNGLAIKFIKTMEKHPKSQCLYLGLTQDSAREIMWPVLHEINDKFNLGCTFLESKLEMKHPNGARIKLMGADLKNFIKRLKGRKYPAVGVDEAQDFGVHLQSLIDDVLTPSIADYEDSWIALTGTPGPVPQGYFFQVTNEKKYGYSHHEWTLMENPHMPDPQGFVKGLIAKREWADDNPTLLREYRNRWVLDVDALWIRYKEKINHFQQLPINVKKWNYLLGIDIGFKDADALAVLAWSDEDPCTYLVEEIITPKQDITALIDQINSTSKKYDFSKMVIDQGGLGLKIAEEMRKRHGVSVQAADKKQKQENVGILNDALRLGKFKAKGSSRFAQDSYLVQIDWEHSTPDRIVVKKKPHSDIIDAVLYAFKESYSYTHQKEEPQGPKYGSKAWADQQQDSMFEAELEGLQNEAKYNNFVKNDGYSE